MSFFSLKRNEKKTERVSARVTSKNKAFVKDENLDIDKVLTDVRLRLDKKKKRRVRK